MVHEVLMAGFGGQGVMAMGSLLAYAGMLDGKQVSWLPSYGPEMRGGTANCHVVISDEPVACPLVTEPTAAIVLNRPSLDRFEKAVRPGGILVYNSSLIDRQPVRTDVRVVAIPANQIAEELGSGRVANMVCLGAFLALTGAVSVQAVCESLRKVLPVHRHDLIPVNEAALRRGRELAQGH
ncbi:MAG: 2-oxoacid:acceptor oxidoreductase family protein [Bacillota bacterium]